MKFDFIQKYIDKTRVFFKEKAKKMRSFFTENSFACDACGGEIFDYPVHRLCSDCEGKMRRNIGRVCPKCGRKTVAEGVCLACKSNLPKFTYGFSPFVYRGETASLINRIKNGMPILASYFGEEMAEYFLIKYADHPALTTEEEVLVIPVPLTETREKERGYNQATELAEAFVRRLRERGYTATVDLEILQKSRETAQQKHMDYQARRENVSGAFHVHKRNACKGRRLVLIDDIMTTGATGSECADRLLHAGAKEVLFIVGASLPERK